VNSHHIEHVLRHLERHPHEVGTWIDRHIVVIVVALVVLLIVVASSGSRSGS
jgi:hypothetical protein